MDGDTESTVLCVGLSSTVLWWMGRPNLKKQNFALLFTTLVLGIKRPKVGPRPSFFDPCIREIWNFKLKLPIISCASVSPKLPIVSCVFSYSNTTYHFMCLHASRSCCFMAGDYYFLWLHVLFLSTTWWDCLCACHIYDANVKYQLALSYLLFLETHGSSTTR
jgi:hypothetical protein